MLKAILANGEVVAVHEVGGTFAAERLAREKGTEVVGLDDSDWVEPEYTPGGDEFVAITPVRDCQRLWLIDPAVN